MSKQALYRHPFVQILNGAFRLVEHTGLQPFSLDADALHARASRRTGLTDFGDDSYRDSLNIFITSLNNEAFLHPAGRFVVGNTIYKSLINRLTLQALRHRKPEIMRTAVDAPIFILGLPRTGTTMLHHLMSADPANRFLSHWESTCPCPLEHKKWRRSRDSRVSAAWLELTLFHKMAPHLMAKHPTYLHGPQECCALFNHSFENPIALFDFNIPSYQDWLFAKDFRLSYRYFADQLRALQWQKSGARWLLKSPMHLGYLKSLFYEFPNARIIQLHREPETVLPSACSLSATVRGVYSDQVNYHEIGNFMSIKLKTELDRCIDARRNLLGKEFIDIKYEDLIKDPIGTVRMIYNNFKIEFPEALASRMEAHLKKNTKYQHGNHQYNLEDFGLNATNIRQQYAEYYDYFL